MAPSEDIFDVIIVGGGPAGLSAALILGRCLRHVLVCDAGNPRNAPARHLNGFISRDSCDPHEFLRISREQLGRYETVVFRAGVVTHAEVKEDGVLVGMEDGRQCTSRLLLLATGLVDDLPRVQRLGEFYGGAVHSCPYCGAWEYRGKPVAVLGSSVEAAMLAIEMGIWSPHVALCSDGPCDWDSGILDRLQRNEVAIVATPIARLEGAQGELDGVRFIDGSLLPCKAVFFSPGQGQRCGLAEKLGCEFSSKSNCIESDENGQTHIPRVYAAGNAAGGVQLVIAAAAKGAVAAVAMNDALLEMDT